MTIFLCIVAVILFILLVVISSITLHGSDYSLSELERRSKLGDSTAQKLVLRLQHYDAITSLIGLKSIIIFSLMSFLLVFSLGWGFGVIAILVALIIFRPLSRLKIVRLLGDQLYTTTEPTIIRSLDTYKWMSWLVRPASHTRHSLKLGSRADLQHLIDSSDNVLSDQEKQLVVNSLAFNDKTVQDVMTPVESIIRVKKSEFLGPLTLNELHTSGHSHLPVIASDIHHIVGILDLDSLLALDVKRSVTAEKAMDPHVHYIRFDQSLSQTLAALLRTHQQLFIVIDEERQTKGVVTPGDIIESLIGRPLIDEFDGHESLRAVAEHKPERTV